MTRKEYNELCDKIWGLKGSICKQCKLGYLKHINNGAKHCYNIEYR